MIKVAVFENEYRLFEPIFGVVNFMRFANNFEFKYFESSQKFGDLENIKEYGLAIIDIELAPKSELDGYGLIKKLLKLKSPPKIAILTGHSKVKESLIEKEITQDFPILQKPIKIDELEKVLKPFALSVSI